MTSHFSGHRVSVLTALILTGICAAPIVAQEMSTREISPARQGMVDPERAASPNGGRPEIYTQEDMQRLSGYTAPGALAYAAMAVEASNRMWPVTLYYRCRNVRGGTSIRAPLPRPMEVFDDVYSIGDDSNNIWAIDTPEGIILIDALTNENDARNIIVRNMQQVGLDPARIRYIIVTHNHLDHFGGAPYLQSISGARIAASRADWEGRSAYGSMPPRGPNDMVLTDGQVISLGGREVTVVLTPGHTPGTISLVFPVTDGANRHVASLFGGQGSPRTIPELAQFRHSLNHFADYTDRMQADVVLSNHTVGDDGLTRIAQLANRRPGEANPYVVGREGVVRYSALWQACLSADIDQLTWNARQQSATASGT